MPVPLWLQVGDFGSSCYEQQQVYSYIQSRFYRAPEVIMGMRYGPAIDMWSLGCVLGELSCGYPIFEGKDEDDQLAAIEEVMGKIPPNLISKANKYQKIGKGRATGRGLPGTKAFSSVVYGDDLFKDFVSQMLQMDPHVRPSPVEIADHKWIKTKTLPRVFTSTSKISL